MLQSESWLGGGTVKLSILIRQETLHLERDWAVSLKVTEKPTGHSTHDAP